MGGISFKFRFFIVTLFISICGSSNFEEDGFSAQDGAFYLNDAVILNAPAVRLTREADNSTRDGKQWLLLQPRQQIDDEAFGQNCLTTVGKKGTCKSFHECFPLLKVADLSGGDGWVMGHYDTCSYVNGDNTEVFGVCCTEPVDTPPQETPDIQRLIQSTHALPYQSISALPFGTGTGLDYATLRQIPIGWPPAIPPLPTHPPDHTAPTHPPLFIAGIITPTTQRPAGYPTWPPATARPTIPSTTRPPLGIINPTAPTQSPVVDGSCGIKNGPQTYESAYDPQDEERIVGGHNADLNEWPWIAVLFNGGRQFCGGSLIDNIHVLTAAHCIAHMTSWDVARLSVRLGDYNIRTNAETQHIERKIKRIVRHRGFNIQTLHNDISILTLDHPVKFTKNIRPVCLPGPGKAYSGAFATVIGWGSLRESGPQPSILQEVTIPIWTNSDCRLRYGPAAPGGIVDHMLCAGRNSMDSCSGDSGGPLTINEGGRWTQVGVVSWGIGCGKGQYPGVYTRVTSFLPWIQKNTMNN